jgi:hypothetical protein
VLLHFDWQEVLLRRFGTRRRAEVQRRANSDTCRYAERYPARHEENVSSLHFNNPSTQWLATGDCTV